MTTIERNQNPTVGDTINLRLVTFNSNQLSNVLSVDQVEIYRLDPTLCSDTNPDGRYLVTTILGNNVTNESTGSYLIALTTSSPTYTIGKYIDKWYVRFDTDDSDPAKVENHFEIYPDLWYTATMPAVYGFDFQFQPNRIRRGSIKWLIIKITPNVPRRTEIERYYTNLAISSNMTISMEKTCGQCPPQQSDADCNDLILDNDLVSVRDKVFGYYQLDTTENGLDLECGIYDVWFTLNYADSIEISPRMQLQIY